MVLSWAAISFEMFKCSDIQVSQLSKSAEEHHHARKINQTFALLHRVNKHELRSPHCG